MQSFRFSMPLNVRHKSRNCSHGFKNAYRKGESRRCRRFKYDLRGVVPIMRNVCFSITKADEDTVNDLVQDAFILAYYSLEKLNDEEKFGEWAAAITKNVSLKYLERKRKVKFMPLSHYLDNMNVESGVSADAVLAEKELIQLIDRLPEGYGKVFRMSVIEGLSHKEIAERLGIEPHSSSSQLARAKAMLRKMINRRMLAVISAIIVMIPLCKYLFQRRDTEEKKTVTAKVEGTKVKSKKTQHVATQPSVTPTMSDNYITKTSTTIPLPQGGADLDSMPKNAMLEIRDTAINIAVAVPPTDSVARDSIQYNIPIFENHIAEDGSKKHKNKWQLLAAGSLGPALVQNAYKLFAGIGDDITDSPTTDIPKVISTWEDYYKFLVRKGGKVSPDTAALITIAEHNTGKIVEREQHDKPITLGLALTKSLGKNWSIESGLQYSLLKSNFTMGEGAYYIQRTQKVHYLGLPFRLSYKWLRSKRWSVYSSAGVLLNIPLVGEAKERYVTDTTVPYKNSWHFTPSWQWSVGAGVGVQYNLSPNWGIYAEPTFNWYIPNGSSIHTIWTEHPFTVTAPFGVRFTW